MGNVKAVVDWHASNSSGLFPHGLARFADRLGLPLQLYTPWFDDAYPTRFNMTESTVFRGTKIVVPDDSYAFFAALFDLGKSMTNGAFSTYEVDFLDKNFRGCASCFEDVGAADRWYAGMARAAYERNVTIQYCLPSATDMLVSLSFPAVVQARASGDYARKPSEAHTPHDNLVTLGGSSLLLGATRMAPSKDTLWTASPQPPTSSDFTQTNYTRVPHVGLDAILATLSLGPVGISDGLNQTDVGLIGQAFRGPRDATLLRPSRPLSTVDACFANQSAGARPGGYDPQAGPDVRGTHAALPGGGPTSHYVVAWMTTRDVTLQRFDLYPPPPPSARLAVRRHVVAPAGAAQRSGCVDGHAASPGCVEVLPAGARPTIPAVGGSIEDFSLTAVYEPAANGAYFLGELTKFVHVSPQRFARVGVGGSGPCGLTVRVLGSAGGGDRVTLVAVDPKGIARIRAVAVPASGSSIDVEM